MLLRNLLICLMFLSLTNCVIEGSHDPFPSEPDAGEIPGDPDAAEATPPIENYLLTFVPASNPSNARECPAPEDFRLVFAYDGVKFVADHLAVFEVSEATATLVRGHAAWAVEERVVSLDFEVVVEDDNVSLSATGTYREILPSNVACTYEATGTGRLGLPPPPPPPTGCFPGVNCPDAGV